MKEPWENWRNNDWTKKIWAQKNRNRAGKHNCLPWERNRTELNWITLRKLIGYCKMKKCTDSVFHSHMPQLWWRDETLFQLQAKHQLDFRANMKYIQYRPEHSRVSPKPFFLNLYNQKWHGLWSSPMIEI